MSVMTGDRLLIMVALDYHSLFKDWDILTLLQVSHFLLHTAGAKSSERRRLYLTVTWSKARNEILSVFRHEVN